MKMLARLRQFLKDPTGLVRGVDALRKENNALRAQVELLREGAIVLMEVTLNQLARLDEGKEKVVARR